MRDANEERRRTGNIEDRAAESYASEHHDELRLIRRVPFTPLSGERLEEHGTITNDDRKCSRSDSDRFTDVSSPNPDRGDVILVVKAFHFEKGADKSGTLPSEFRK